MGIINVVFNFLIKKLPKKIKRTILEEYYLLPYGNISYSQEGEDLILNRIFEGKNRGFYIDAGAHHPIRFSNTYKFYLKGWNGVNIDALPGSMVEFNKIRIRDINIEAAISTIKGKFKYYMFNDPALNTFSEEVAEKINQKPGFFINEIKILDTETLNELLEKSVPDNQDIDFLSIDIEGVDCEVIKTLNLKKYKPKIILIEIKDFAISSDIEITDFFKKNHYSFYAKTVNTIFFKLNESL